MTIFITTGDYNRVTGIYNENNAVEGAVKITTEQHEQILLLWPNVSFVDGVVAYLDYYSLISLTEIKTLKMGEINSLFETAFLRIRDDTPPSEVGTWAKQEADALAWAKDSTAATPFVDAIATARGVDRVELLGKVLTKANAYAEAAALLTGLRQKFEDLVDAATTNAEVTAITVAYW